MTKAQLQKLYGDLNNWILAGLGEDIVALPGQRTEYQHYVERAKKEGKEDVPQAVLWMLREEINRAKDDMTLPAIMAEKQPLKKNEKGHFVKGNPKVAGRAKGTPNKANLTMAASLARINFDIASESVAIFRATTDRLEKMKIIRFLAQYCYPKLKEMELDLESNEEPSDRFLSSIIKDDQE